MDREKLLEFYHSHRGGINGALTALFVAILILTIGFFRTLFIFICVTIGYYVGNKLSEDKNYIKNFLDRILPPGTYR